MRYLPLLGALSLVSASLCSATVIRVDLGGGGDFTTIQGGINAAGDGDTVLVAPGTYTGDGNRDLHFWGTDLALISEAGPLATIIDCEANDVDRHRGFHLDGGETPQALIQGFTVRDGSVPQYGSGIFLEDSSPTIRDCVLADGWTRNGAGLCCLGASPILFDVVLSQNRAWGPGGGLYCGDGSSPMLTQVVFTENRADGGGGIYCESGSEATLTSVTIEECWTSYWMGGAVYLEESSYVSMENCTIVRNSAQAAAAILCELGSTLVAENSIFAFNGPGGYWIHSAFASVSFACCDIYGHEYGDWLDPIADQYGINGNISEDPLFCGQENPDAPYSLSADSPCAPAANPQCGLLGAWPVGCLSTATSRTSWGRLKSLYR